jgi:hypothetical protein
MFKTASLNLGSTWLFIILGLGIFTRAYFLSQPIRGDEAYTFLTYIQGSFSALFEYSAPNNHILNTLLIKFVTTFFPASPASIRFPAFLAGLAGIILMFFLCRSLHKSPYAGIFAAALTAVFPYLILYSTNARGYTLIVALTIVVVWIGHRFVDVPSKTGVFWLALFSALGLLAMPTMVLPLAGIFFWLLVLLLLKRTPLNVVLRQFVLPFGLLSALFTTVFYAPVVYVSGGVAPIVANKFVDPQNWNDFLRELLPQLQNSFTEITRDIHPAMLGMLLLLVVLGFVGSFKQRNWATLLLLPAFFLGAVVILLIQHTNPYARTWIYLIPFILLLADAGLVFLLEYLPKSFPKWLNTAILVMAFFFAVHLTSKNVILTYLDTNFFPEAPIAVKYLKPILKPGDELRISSHADWAVYFYFWYDGMSSMLYDSAPSTGRIFFVHKKSRGPLTEDALKKFTLLFETGNMDIYEGRR